MAGEHILETKILLRYDTYTNWIYSDLILKPGEAAIATFPYRNTISNTNDQPANTPPAVGIKIGDGEHTFANLPWVQAIAADVYTWAKSNSKPIYQASEIQNLVSYIQRYAPSTPGDGTIAPRIYSLVRGTGDNINKYYLQYKESTDATTWTIEQNSYIDISAFEKLVSWIGDNVDTSLSIDERIEGNIKNDLANINYSDSDTNHMVVSAVSQTKTKISVSKKQLDFSDLTGYATVAQGGTGVQTLPANEVLVGNGTNAVSTRPIASIIDTGTGLTPSNVVKAYVDNAVAGLQGAMHFIGEATVEPTTGDPVINGYNFLSDAARGDVVLWEQKEYVWTGSVWRLLGDEGSYIVHGAIIDSDVAANAAIQQSKISGLTAALNNKVDKVDNKQLSTNDYTNADQTKLTGIEAGAQVNTVESVSLNGTVYTPDASKNIAITITQDTLNLNVIEGAQYSSGNSQVPLTVTNRKINVSKIAATGNIDDLLQTSGTYIILNCGSSTEVI